jgi:serine/threonine-protein kinase HipA
LENASEGIQQKVIRTPEGKVTEVRLWGIIVGYAYWDRKQRCAQFQYDPSFLDKGYDVAPITMPLSNGIFTFGHLSRETYNGLPGMLADSLPDSYGNALIDVWLARNGIPWGEFTPLDRLCYVGKRGMGALEYYPVLRNGDVDELVDVDMLSSLAEEVLRQRGGIRTGLNEKGLNELLSVGTSAGGARPKAVVGLNERTGEIRSGQLDLPEEYTYWIIKFDTETEKKIGYCRIEHAYYEMAKACGIEMTECRLLDTGSKAHFMTKRFDRVDGEKLHMQTLCAMVHRGYKDADRYSYEGLLRTMRGLRLRYDDMDQVFRRMVFNVIMRNQDDHTKNFSFLMGKDGKWRSSPAYDVTYAYDPSNYWTNEHQMSVNGRFSNIGRNDLKGLADNAGIKDPEDVIEMTLSVASEWSSYAKLSGVPKEAAEAVGRSLLEL